MYGGVGQADCKTDSYWLVLLVWLYRPDTIEYHVLCHATVWLQVRAQGNELTRNTPSRSVKGGSEI